MDIKEQITATAKELFLQYGIRSVSVDDICKELRMSKKTFYQYFGQKEELINHLLEKHRSRQIDEFNKNRTRKSQNVIDKLLKNTEDFIKSKLLTEINNKKYRTLAYDLEKYYPKLYKEHNLKMRDIVLKNVYFFIEQGIKEGLFRKDLQVDMTALFFVVQMKHLFSSFKECINVSLSEIFEFTIESFIRILANENGMKYYLEKRKIKIEL